jgi:WD40 repeat protein
LRDAKLRVWDIPAGKTSRQLVASGPSCAALAFSWDGQFAAAADNAGAVRVWDWPSGKERSPLETPPERRGLRNLAFAPNGRVLAATEATGKEPAGLRTWDLPSGRLRGSFQAALEPEGYSSLAFSNDSRSLAVGHFQRGVKILDATTGAELANIPMSHQARRQSLAFAVNGESLAIGFGGPTVKLWEPAGKRELSALRSPTGFNGVCGLGFVYGPTLVAVTPDGQVIHWPRLASDRGQSIAFPGSINSAAVASDGRHLITANMNGTIYILRMSPVGEAK